MISIALASYNGSKYIREQIDSILAQTYQDFELIVCDDCSTDDTWQVLQEYAEKDNRIKIFENETNIGFKKNFEKAISLCKGDYIALSDQDDVRTENHLEVLKKGMKDYSISCGNSILTDIENHSLGINLNQVDGLFYFEPGAKFIYRSLLSGNCLQGANMLMPKIFVKKCLPIPEKVLFHDAWFSACACLENGVNYTFEIINNYRQHGNNITFSRRENTHKASVFQKIKNLKNKIISDRFFYVEELKNRYGMENRDFEFIYKILNKIRHDSILNIHDIIILWKNYYYIKTQKTHKDFLNFLLTIHRWK